jgi:hypothetical protein
MRATSSPTTVINARTNSDQACEVSKSDPVELDSATSPQRQQDVDSTF